MISYLYTILWQKPLLKVKLLFDWFRGHKMELITDLIAYTNLVFRWNWKWNLNIYWTLIANLGSFWLAGRLLQALQTLRASSSPTFGYRFMSRDWLVDITLPWLLRMMFFYRTTRTNTLTLKPCFRVLSERPMTFKFVARLNDSHSSVQINTLK